MKRSVDITNELLEISPVVAAIPVTAVFEVPIGYFDALAAHMLDNIAGNNGKDDLPAGYFDLLAGNILSKIEGTAMHELQQLSPVLAAVKKDMPYDLPEHYFEQLADETMVLTTAEKMPAVLEQAGKSIGFDLPEGYFEKLAENVVDKIKLESPTKVISIGKPVNKIWKYAAAAVFTGIIATGIMQYPGITGKQNTGATAVVPATWNEKAFNEKMETLSEDDIIRYLEKNGSEADVAALSSVIEDNAIPTQEEYFMDANTLDKFLEGIEQTN